MANFEEIISKHKGEDGSIPATAIANLTKAISTAVGNEFVEKSRYKAKLEEIDTLKGEKQTAEDSATTAGKWKTKYDALKSEYDEYKAEQGKKESRASKESAYKAVLKDAGISESGWARIIKANSADVDALELDEKGKAKTASEIAKSIKAEWPEFVATTSTRGADPANPPANNGGNSANATAAQIARNYHTTIYGKE